MATLTMRRLQLPKCSIGAIVTSDRIFQTIERPWKPCEHGRAGTPFESCIPYGKYLINKHDSHQHGQVWSLSNSKLGVFIDKESRSFSTDRYACLIHVANWVQNVVGCIGVGQGLGYNPERDQYMVTKSANAIDELRLIMDGYKYLEILPYEQSLH